MGRSRKGAVLGLVATTTLLACNGILGLDDFVATQCTGGRCDGGVDATSGDGSADASLDALGTAPVSWAQWRMPNYPSDAAVENIATYTVTGDSAIDSISKLVWQTSSKSSMSYADALASCTAGWRLPSRIELVTLLDLSKQPTIDRAIFQTDSASYWTASEVRPYVASSRKRWVVDFSSGTLGQIDETSSASVRCIKGQP